MARVKEEPDPQPFITDVPARVVRQCPHCLDWFTLEDIEDGDMIDGVCVMCRKAGRR